ncbi:amidohydrolase [Thalassomonas haliotis]|uniref:Amidohydrolase family protein n=1 Tax=Thalassomonas haliotis TaxID=485448 RepID=A0ABY7VA71_9GAMM|nr:amidohydrolase [Thalassomonas haliotis]WDE10505.1 amidohydrolase family protein [Thalassomonas haliotis]
MKNKLLSLALLLTPALACAQSTLISNINGYTLKENRLLSFNAIEFQDDEITRLYQSGDKLPDIKGQQTRHINGEGKTLLPGLIDAHGHVLGYGLSLLRADLTNTASELEAAKRVLNYAQKNKDLTWLQGRGWNQVQWPGKSFPGAASLDQYFPDRPVWLRRIDGHAGWANSKAMALAGITKDTVSPRGGEIIRDSQGNASGVFIDNAMTLIESKIPPLTITEQKAILVKAMNALAAVGLTSVHDAGISVANLKAYQALSREQKMPIRVNAMLDITDKQWRDVLKQGPVRSADDFLKMDSVKVVADGALGSRGAALIEDYSDHAGHKGLLLFSDKKLLEVMKTAMDAGFQVNTHAIGDNANKRVLDNYQQLVTTSDKRALRHRVEHAQVLRLADIPRFKQLGVIASMQATHATSDKNMAQDRLGKDRIAGAYAWQKLLQTGATLAAGSDFPIESANPFYGLHASITRQDHNNLPRGGWFADEKMTRQQAFKSFSLDAAYAGHQEQLLGSLIPGKKADFILIDRDIFTVKAEEIWQTQVVSTWVNGKQVYQK